MNKILLAGAFFISLVPGAFSDDLKVEPKEIETVQAAETQNETAEEVEKTEKREEMLITATRVENSVKNVPANATIITAEDIKAGHYVNLTEALESKAGIHFVSVTGNAAKATLDVRGFGGNAHGRTLVLLNGRRMNRPDMASINWLQIPVSNIERVEVVKGANSTLYGDHAVAAVINIITKKGSEDVNVNLQTNFGSDGFNQQSATITGSAGDLNFAVTGDNQSSDGYRNNTAYSSKSGGINLDYQMTEDLNTYLNLSTNKNKYELAGSLNKQEFKNDPKKSKRVDDHGVSETHNIDAGFDLKLGEYNTFKLDTGFSQTDDYSKLWSIYDKEITSFSISPKYIITAPLFELKNELLIGVDYENIEMDLIKKSATTGKITGESATRKNSLGVYAHNSLHLIEDKLIFTLGARSEIAKFDFDNNNQVYDKTNRANSYHIGLTARPTESVKVFAKYDTLYRYPFMDEYITYGQFMQDLEAEKGKSYELGFEYEPNESFNFAATFFRTEMEDEIGFRSTGAWTGVNENMDKTIHQGVELSSKYIFNDHFNMWAGYTYQQAEFTDGANEGERIALTPKDKAILGAEVTIIEDLRFTAEAVYTGNRTTESTGQYDILSSYTTVDLGLHYDCEIKDVEMNFFAGVNNVFDEKYAAAAYTGPGYGGYYPANGRTYMLGLGVNF